jgi:hypothetical protein
MPSVGQEFRMNGSRVRVVRAYGIDGRHYGVTPEHAAKRSMLPNGPTEPSYEVELLEDMEPHKAGTLVWAKGEELE